jgi:hypothetical protein
MPCRLALQSISLLFMKKGNNSLKIFYGSCQRDFTNCLWNLLHEARLMKRFRIDELL